RHWRLNVGRSISDPRTSSFSRLTASQASASPLSSDGTRRNRPRPPPRSPRSQRHARRCYWLHRPKRRYLNQALGVPQNSHLMLGPKPQETLTPPLLSAAPICLREGRRGSRRCRGPLSESDTAVREAGRPFRLECALF